MTELAHGAVARDSRRRHWLVVGAVLLLLGIPEFFFYHHIDPNSRTDDPYFIWIEGRRLHEGVNPYSRIHESDMRANNKYATYLPTAYYAGAALARLGFDRFETFARWLKWICFISHIAIAGVLVSAMLSRFGVIGAATGAAIWTFHRWSNGLVHLDPPAMLFFLLALELWRRDRRFGSAVALGLSLAIKHMAIFCVPLFALAALTRPRPARRGWIQAAMVIAIALGLPLLISLPLIANDPVDFAKSMLFSATRYENKGFGLSLDARIHLTGLLARIPMFLLLLGTYWTAIKARLQPATGSMLVFAIFIGFNTMIFEQYLIWLIPIPLLALAEIMAPMPAPAQHPNLPQINS